MLSLLLTLALTGQLSEAQAWTTPVPFHVQAEPLSVAIERLSKITGEPLKVQPALADDLVIVHTDSSTPQVIIDKIAWAEYGKWVDIDHVKTLISGRLTPVEARSQYEKYFARLIQNEFDKQPLWSTASYETDCKDAFDLYKQAVQARDQAAVEKISKELNQNEPARRLFVRLGAEIGAPTLAKIPDRSQLVFSTIPSRYHRPMPQSIGQLLANYKKEGAVWLQNKPTGSTPYLVTMDQSPATVNQSDDIMLKVNNTGHDSLSMELWYWKPDGPNSLQIINSPTTFPSSIHFINEMTLPANLKGDFIVSDETEKRVDPLQHPNSYNLDEKRAFSQRLIDEISNGAPDTLQAIHNDLVSQVALKSSKLVVGLVDDNTRFLNYFPQEVTLSLGIRFYFDRDMDFVDEPSFWGFRPRSALYGETFQLPRKNFAGTLSQFIKQPEISFFGVADALRGLDLTTMENVMFKSEMVTGFTTGMSGSMDMKAMKVATFIDGKYRQDLINNGSTDVSLNLIPGLKAFVIDQLANKDQSIREDKQFYSNSDFSAWGSGNLSSQRTLLLDHLNPNDIQLHLEYRSEDAAAAKDEAQQYDQYHIDSLESIIRRFYPNLDLSKPQGAENTTVVLIPISSFRVRIKLPGGHSIVWFTYVPKALKLAPPFSADNPPPAFSEEIKRIKERAKKQREELGLGPPQQQFKQSI